MKPVRLQSFASGRSCCRLAFAFAFLLSALGRPAGASAAERVWDGGARDDGWNDIGNWVGVGVPAAGDDLRFPAGALKPSNNNDFAAGTTFNVLTYDGAGYTATGNEIGLTGGIVVSHGAGNTSLHLPINAAVNQTFTVSLAGANLYLFGAVDLVGARTILTFDGAGQTVVVGNISDSRVVIGGGTIRKNGPGTLYVLQNLTLGGPTIVNGGTLIMDGRMSNSAVTVNASATLRGTGKVGGLTVNSGGTVGPGLNSPAILDSLGDVALNAGSTFNVRLNGTTVSLNYDQLKVQGAVTLGGTLNVTAGFVAAVGDTFTIIENDGTDDVVGTFAGLPERAILMVNGRPFQISYGTRGLGGFGRDVNDVTLEAVPALAVWDGGGGLNKFWSQPLNWVSDVLPMPGDDVQFAHSGSSVLATMNDFPAGRLFGSLIFSGGDHRVEGNAADFTDIRLIAPGDAEVHMPVGIGNGIRVAEVGSVRMFGAVALRASQTFRTERTNSFLGIYGDIAAENHEVVVDGIWSAGMYGILSGTGALVKNGSGRLAFNGTNALPLTTVNAGTLDFDGRFYGTVVVNPGGRVEGGFLQVSGLQDLDVRGGTFAPSFGASVHGTLRMTEGATFAQSIFQGQNEATSYYAVVDQPAELTDCKLNISISPNTVIEPGREFTVIARFSGPAATGNFNGLPEGTRFLLGGHVFTITYQGGTYGTYVSLIAGAPFVWDGGGSGNVWGTAANWSPDFAPIAGSALVFPANVAKLGMINAFDPGTSFRSLTFGAASYLVVGNAFRLTEGIYNDFSSGETIISADFVASGSFSQPFECRVSNASRLRLEGSVTRDNATANWKKTGTGVLRFTGTGINSQSSVDVQAGELELDKPSGVDAISTALQIGDGTNDVRVTLLDEDQIADGASVTIRNRARLDLNGNNETIDRLQGDGTVSTDGRFGPGRAGRLTVNSGSFSGAIVGDGGLTKVGSSSSALTLVGNNTFSGLTILSGGTLAVEGILANSPIRLDGGILRGRGSVGTITGNSGGTLQPGSGGADFQVALHSLGITLNPSTTFRVFLTSIDPGYENHKLQVAGAVSLGGSVLSVDLSGVFKPAPGRSFVIIENDGADPIVGTFAGLPQGAVFGGDGLPFQISYVGGTGNDVVITRVATPPSTFNSITALGNGQVSIEGLGIGGVVYSIQAASNLNPVILWTPVGSGTGNASGIFQYLDTSATQRPMRFYRAVSP